MLVGGATVVADHRLELDHRLAALVSAPQQQRAQAVGLRMLGRRAKSVLAVLAGLDQVVQHVDDFVIVHGSLLGRLLKAAPSAPQGPRRGPARGAGSRRARCVTKDRVPDSGKACATGAEPVRKHASLAC
jgi:hypothetical protein